MRLAAAALGLVLLVAGALYGLGGPRLTMVNTGLHIEYPWARGLALLAASLGTALWAWALPRRWMRGIAAAATLVSAVAALGRFAYHLDAGPAGIEDRDLMGSTRVTWKDVRRVDAGPALILVWGPGDAQVRVGTAGFGPEQRAILERTISRRVREAQATPSGAAVTPGGPGPQRQ